MFIYSFIYCNFSAEESVTPLQHRSYSIICYNKLIINYWKANFRLKAKM